MTRFLAASIVALGVYAHIPQPEIMIIPAVRIPSTIERIVSASMDAELPPHIALDRFWHESRWRHIVDGKILRNNGHDCGIAQLSLRWNPGACDMTEDQSIREGVRQLAGYWREFHDERLVRISYTAGESVARRSR